MDQQTERLMKDRLSEEAFFVALSGLIEGYIKDSNSLERADREVNHVFYHGKTQGLRMLLNRLTELHNKAQEEIANGQV